MRLYYFTSERFGLESIRDEWIKIARIDELNDPFELVAPKLETPADRVKFEEAKAMFSRHSGIVCLSTDWKHPLMWSHYANKHQGIVLGFDVELENDEGEPVFEKVEYVPERPPLSEFGITTLVDMSQRQLRGMYERVLGMKFSAWCYESEYRGFSRLELRDPITQLYFHRFEPEMKLVQVILGHRCEVSEDRVAGVLGSRGAGVVISRATLSEEGFEMMGRQ